MTDHIPPGTERTPMTKESNTNKDWLYWYENPSESASKIEQQEAEIERLRAELRDARLEIVRVAGEGLRAIGAAVEPRASETPAPEPAYWVRSFWSPDRQHLITAHVSGGVAVNIIAFQDDNGREWEPAGEQQNMASPSDIQSRPLYTCAVAGCPGNHLSQGSVCVGNERRCIDCGKQIEMPILGRCLVCHGKAVRTTV